ncbi:MAG: peptidoglycan-binding protein, partial [Solirubrobacterales bacterium]|nr:peptidoglycan-binding protein [Solirubrobacterales bacterium]
MSPARYDAATERALVARDLSSVELWERSLARSRHRRRLAALARRARRRRKSVSLALSAALAAGPVVPQTIAAAGAGSSSSSATSTDPHGEELSVAARVVLRPGAEGPLVLAVQRRLDDVLPLTHLVPDGIYGPLTEAAVADFQRRHGLPPTGTLDVRTWASLFRAPVIVIGGPRQLTSAPQPAESVPGGHARAGAPAREGGGTDGGAGFPSAASASAPPYTAAASVAAPAAAPAESRVLARRSVAHDARAGARARDAAGSSRLVATPQPPASSAHPATGPANSGGPSSSSAGNGSAATAPTPAGSGSAAPAPTPARSGSAAPAPTPTGSGSAAAAPAPAIAVVTPAAPAPSQTSVYVLTDGVALPLPRQYIANGSVDQGVDYAAPGGTPLYAMGEGIIVGEGISGFGPNAPILEITSGPLKGLEVYYGHAGADLVSVGDHVSAGQQISEVGYGIVGISTGPHLEIGFYPPGPVGAGSRMLAVIENLLSQHPSGRAWGAGGTPVPAAGEFRPPAVATSSADTAGAAALTSPPTDATRPVGDALPTAAPSALSSTASGTAGSRTSTRRRPGRLRPAGIKATRISTTPRLAAASAVQRTRVMAANALARTAAKWSAWASAERP